MLGLLKLSPELPSSVAFLDYVLFGGQYLDKLTLFCILGHESIHVHLVHLGPVCSPIRVMGTAAAGLGGLLSPLRREVVSQPQCLKWQPHQDWVLLARCSVYYLVAASSVAEVGTGVCLLIDYLTPWHKRLQSFSGNAHRLRRLRNGCKTVATDCCCLWRADSAEHSEVSALSHCRKQAVPLFACRGLCDWSGCAAVD